jgi:hypothetical protein
MGYSKNTRAAQRVANHLNEMIAVDGRKTITWQDEDAARRSYQIREAMSLPAYRHLKIKYIIRTRGNKIIAEPRALDPLPTQLGTMTLYEVSDVLEIIGAALQHKANELFFPDARDVDFPKLYNWTSRNGYFIIPSDEGVTLTKADPGDIAWTP